MIDDNGLGPARVLKTKTVAKAPRPDDRVFRWGLAYTPVLRQAQVNLWEKMAERAAAAESCDTWLREQMPRLRCSSRPIVAALDAVQDAEEAMLQQQQDDERPQQH